MLDHAHNPMTHQQAADVIEIAKQRGRGRPTERERLLIQRALEVIPPPPKRGRGRPRKDQASLTPG